MADNIVTANPGAGGALFKTDLVSGTSTPYMKISSTDVVQIFGSVGVSTGAFTGQVSTFPVGTTQVFGQISTFPHSLTGTSQISGQVTTFPIGTTQVNIVSSVALGFTPTGTSMVNVVSTVPQTLAGQVSTFAIGTTQVNIVSSVALGFTPTGTSMVNIVSSVALGFTPTGTSMVNVVSSNTKGPLDLISSTVFADNAAYVPGTSRLGIIGGYFVSTVATLAHSDAGAARVDSTGAFIIAPGSAETTISTTPLVRVAVFNNTDQQVVGFGSGTQYLDGSATTTPTGMVAMWKSGAANSTMSAVSTTQPLPIFQVSSNPLSISGTTQVNIVSSIALGFTPTGTSFVSISSSQPIFVSQSSAPWSANVTSFPSGTQSTAPIPASQGGLDSIWYPSVTTAPRTIKNSAGRLFDIWFSNAGTSMAWLKLYNASSAVVSTGTTAPLLAFGLPAGSSGVSGWLGSAMGYQFSTAISVSVTASSQTSTDTSTPPTNAVNLFFGYK